MQHIKLKHKYMLNSTVTCKFNDCNDQFTNVYSLRRHVLNKHYISKTKLASSITSKRINDTAFDTNSSKVSATSTSAILNWNKSNKCQDKIDNMIETNDPVNDEKFDIDIYQSTVFKSALSSVVKMYAD